METISIVLTGLVILLSLVLFYRRTGTILHPFAFIAAICFLVQVVGPMTWVIEGISNYRGVPIMDYMVQAEIIFSIGYVSFCVAFFVSNSVHRYPKGRIVRLDYDDCQVDIDCHWIYILYFVSLTLYVFYMRLNGRSFLSQLSLGQRGTYFESTIADSSFLFLAISINMLISCSCLLLFVDKGVRKILVYVVTVLLTISSGRRHLMLDIVLAPLIVRYVKKGKSPNIVILTMGFIISYLLVGWIGAMRSVYRYGEGTLTAYDSSSAWDAVMINLEVFMVLCMYIPGLNDISSFGFGSSYVTAILQLIPSIIFPFKREIIGALTLGKSGSVLGERFLAEGIAGTYWSLLYANGWIFGVILGMVLLGRWVKKIEKKLSFNRISYYVEYALLTTFMFQFLTRSFGNALQDMIGLFFPIFLLRKMSSIKHWNG